MEREKFKRLNKNEKRKVQCLEQHSNTSFGKIIRSLDLLLIYWIYFGFFFFFECQNLILSFFGKNLSIFSNSVVVSVCGCMPRPALG